jgi:hypothetical protein
VGLCALALVDDPELYQSCNQRHGADARDSVAGAELLQWMPEGRAVPEYKRQLAAIGLTTQMFAGVGLGIAAQALLAWGLIFHVMPALGLDLLYMARAVAAFDLPMQLWQIFARIL